MKVQSTFYPDFISKTVGILLITPFITKKNTQMIDIWCIYAVYLREKVPNYALLRCKTFSLKNWLCKIFEKYHVWVKITFASSDFHPKVTDLLESVSLSPNSSQTLPLRPSAPPHRTSTAPMPRPLEGHNSAPDLFPGLGLGAPRVLLVKPWLCILQDYGDDYHNVDNDDDGDVMMIMIGRRHRGRLSAAASAKQKLSTRFQPQRKASCHCHCCHCHCHCCHCCPCHCCHCYCCPCHCYYCHCHCCHCYCDYLFIICVTLDGQADEDEFEMWPKNKFDDVIGPASKCGVQHERGWGQFCSQES